MADTKSPPVLSIGVKGDSVTMTVTCPEEWKTIYVYLPADEARAYAQMMVTAANSIDGGEEESCPEAEGSRR